MSVELVEELSLGSARRMRRRVRQRWGRGHLLSVVAIRSALRRPPAPRLLARRRQIARILSKERARRLSTPVSAFAAHETEEKTHARHATMVKKAIKGKKVDLSSLVANNKSHIPDRPVERAEGESGFFRRDYQDRDRPTYRSEGDDNWRGGGGGGGFGGGGSGVGGGGAGGGGAAAAKRQLNP